MSREEEIEDSLEFCRDIYVYLEPNLKQNTYQQAYMETSIQSVSSATEKHFGTVSDTGTLQRPKADEESSVFFNETFKLMICIIIAFLSAKMITSYVVQITTVHGTSMEHTIQNKDRILQDKLWYRFHDPERFEIIVFSKNGDANLIKRIIGMPGETVSIAQGNIYIDDKRLVEHFGMEPIEMEGDFTVTLGEDEYFVLGDNRNVSLDSRFVSIGPVKKSEISGRALVRVYPFDKMKLVS